MKCYYCNHDWIAVSPVEAQELECPQCHKMTSVLPATAVEYATVTLRFTYLEGGRPEPGVAVLGAWTNGTEFHVTPSVWDGHVWRDDDNGRFALNAEYRIYAWAEWPAAPPL